MKILITFFVLLIVILSCKPKEYYNIICEIDGLKNQTAEIVFLPESNPDIEIIDTVLFINGKLQYNFNAKELYEAVIIPFDLFFKFENGDTNPLPSSRIHFYIDSLDQITITGRIENNLVRYKAVGNALSENLSEAREMKIPLLEDRIEYEFNYNSLKPNRIDDKTYMEFRSQFMKKTWSLDLAYIETHLDKEYSARLLSGIGYKDTVQLLYNKLTPDVKSSYFGMKLRDKIDGWMLTTPGVQFPNLIDNTLDGEQFELSDFQGKYVLLDFWGSWCSPCIAEIPKLKQVKENYKDVLEIIGIACNDNEDRLRRLISAKEIDWKNIISDQTKTSDYARRFGISGFPTKILLDPEGKVIKVYSGTDESLYSDLKIIL